MPTLLTAVAQQNLKTIQVNVDPQATWLLRVDKGAEGISSSTIAWVRYPLSAERRLLAQRLLLSWWKPAVVEGDATIKENEYRKADILIRILVLCEAKHPKRNLCELDKSDWIQLAILMLFHIWKDRDTFHRQLISIDQPMARQHLERCIYTLKAWYISYQQGDVSDGPEYNLTQTQINKALRSEFHVLGFDFDDWIHGGSFGVVPFVVAHLLLARALEILQSLRTRQLLAYFETVREQNAYDILPYFWDGGRNKQLCRYRENGDIGILSITHNWGEDSKSNRAKIGFAIPLHQKLLALHAGNTTFEFPWRNYENLIQDYNVLRSTIYVIFLSVMGKRGPSEIRTLRGVDITPSNAATGEDALMRPSIEKTNQGLRESQGVTNFIDQAFITLLQLSYIDKTHTELPLFSPLPSINKARTLPMRLSHEQLSADLHKYYDAFCVHMADKVDFEIKVLHRSITSHQFRHSFAEFALRRFDGNVEELIRQHFCHRYNHWWTKRYTADKLDSKREINMNRNYIRELVPRVLHDSELNPDFVGGMALFIKKQLGEHIKVLTPEQAEAHIDTFCKDVVQLTAHEYGWCLLHTQYKSVAKCADKTGSPNPTGTNSEKCIPCANFCASRKSHLGKQTQIAISHIDFIEQKIWKMPSIVNASKTAVRNAQKLFPELNELGVV